VGTQRAPLWSDAEGVDKLPGEWSGWLARAPDRGLPMATAAAGPTPSMTVPAPPPLATAGPTPAAAPPRHPHHSAGTSDTAACGPGRACTGTLTRPWDRAGSLLRPVGAAAHRRGRAATAVARLTTPGAG